MSNCLAAVVDSNGTLHPASSAAVVPWWSFTKTLIAACVLVLSERRLIALDLPLDGLPFTPRQLLQHRAGIGNYGRRPRQHRRGLQCRRPSRTSHGSCLHCCER
jgi:CubicO group peptidase (beta-lactamase class C family)